MDRACKNCHMLVKGSTCPLCKSQNLSDRWSGYLIVLDTSGEISKKLDIPAPGKYALKVR